MGDVIDDFYDSDAPQFKGKSKEKRRQMAIAAKLQADEEKDHEVSMAQAQLDKSAENIKKLKKKLGKKEKALWKGKGRPPIYKQVLKESDWKKYYGSHAFIIDELNNATGTDTKKYRYFPLKREIIHVAYSKKELTYLECKYQFSLSVLEDRKYLNDNILGKFFDKDFA